MSAEAKNKLTSNHDAACFFIFLAKKEKGRIVFYGEAAKPTLMLPAAVKLEIVTVNVSDAPEVASAVDVLSQDALAPEIEPASVTVIAWLAVLVTVYTITWVPDADAIGMLFGLLAVTPSSLAVTVKVSVDGAGQLAVPLQV